MNGVIDSALVGAGSMFMFGCVFFAVKWCIVAARKISGKDENQED